MIITWKAERNLDDPFSSVGVPIFAEKTSKENCIKYYGFCPDILVQQKHVLNLTHVSNPIIIQRTTWIHTLMTEDRITHTLWLFILLKSRPGILPLLSDPPPLPRAEQLALSARSVALNRGLTMLKKKTSCSRPNEQLNLYCLDIATTTTSPELQLIALFWGSFTLILPLFLVQGPILNSLVSSAGASRVYF